MHLKTRKYLHNTHQANDGPGIPDGIQFPCGLIVSVPTIIRKQWELDPVSLNETKTDRVWNEFHTFDMHAHVMVKHEMALYKPQSDERAGW